jgi:hypothetical protein
MGNYGWRPESGTHRAGRAYGCAADGGVSATGSAEGAAASPALCCRPEEGLDLSDQALELAHAPTEGRVLSLEAGERRGGLIGARLPPGGDAAPGRADPLRASTRQRPSTDPAQTEVWRRTYVTGRDFGAGLAALACARRLCPRGHRTARHGLTRANEPGGTHSGGRPARTRSWGPRAGILKIWWAQARGGSIPPPGTNQSTHFIDTLAAHDHRLAPDCASSVLLLAGNGTTTGCAPADSRVWSTASFFTPSTRSDAATIA